MEPLPPVVRLLQRCKDGVDRISQLPKEIKVHILSFLPLKDAAATSVLSRRWKSLWKHTPNLIFKDFWLEFDDNKCKYVDWVNSVLKSYESLSLVEFTVTCRFDKSTQHMLIKWLEFAFSRRVKRLELIWDEIFINKMKDIVLEEILKEMTIPSRDYFKSLIVLCLKGFTMSGDAVEFFQRNCPLLERLVVCHVTMTSDLEVGGSSLKHLDIRSSSRWSSRTSLIKVSCPNLTWLTINHEPKRVFLENVPKLVNMNIFFHYGDNVHDFAEIAAQLETLIITLYHPKRSFSIPEMPKLKRLVVYHRYADPGVRLPVTCFLQACPRLEEFKLEISDFPIRNKIFHVDKPKTHLYLKRFVLAGFCGGSSDRMKLVRYIVESCIALEEIVIGQCDRTDLIRSFADYCVPLDEIIPPPPEPFEGCRKFFPTPMERRAFLETLELQRRQMPSRIKLTIL